MSEQPPTRKERALADYHRRRADMDPMHRAVSDALDEYLIRLHGKVTSHTHPEDFLAFLAEEGYSVTVRQSQPAVHDTPGGSKDVDEAAKAAAVPSQLHSWHQAPPEVTFPDLKVWTRYVEAESGRLVLAGLLLLGERVTSDHLRKVPVTALENSINLSREDTARDELERLGPLQRTPGADPDEFSRLVAQHFKLWASRVPHPAAAMAAENGVKLPTMHTWIREARLRGYLPRASPKRIEGDQ